MRSIGARLLLWLTAIGVIAPFIVVAGVSVGKSKTISFPPEELSVTWYRILFTDPDWLKAIGASLLVAVCAALIAVTLAFVINYVLWLLKSAFSRFTFAMALGPFLLPPIILALGASLFWAEAGWYGRIEATMISHGIFLVTLPLVIIARGFANLTDDVIEAATIMGATPRQLLTSIILPLITPYLLTGFALVAIISVNEYLIANMISGFVVETLPIKIFNNVRYGYTPVVASASMLFVGITVVVLLLVARSTDLLALLGSKNESADTR
jgi:putative spermidine/putrescine transport system permease protein